MTQYRAQDLPGATRVPPIRPSAPFVLLVVAFAATGLLLAMNGTTSVNSGGFFRPDRSVEIMIFAFVAIGWVLSLVFHEAAHAIFAWIGGDHTVEDKGYLNLDPRKYTDLNMSILFPMLILIIGGLPLPGGAVWIQTNLIRSRAARSMMSFAGPLASLLFGAAMTIPVAIGLVDRSSHTALAIGMSFLGYLSVFAFVLNMVPVPGFDGFGILEPHLSPQLLTALRPVRQYGIWVVIGLIFFFPPARDLLFDLMENIYDFLGGNIGDVSNGWNAFRFWS